MSWWIDWVRSIFGQSGNEMLKKTELSQEYIHFQNHTVKTKSRVFKSDKYVMKFTMFE
jgi:hypothetical protein